MSNYSREHAGASTPETSLAHDVFHVIFQSFDTASSVWMPWVKGFGRFQLEAAQLASRQMQVMMEHGQRAALCRSLPDLQAQNVATAEKIVALYTDAVHHMSTAAARMTPAPFALDKAFARPALVHDVLTLPEMPLPMDEPVRKVA